eukprot:1152689-Pelagomonas_calceolata.AAC.1
MAPPRGTYSRTCVTCFENSKCAVTLIQHDNLKVGQVGDFRTECRSCGCVGSRLFCIPPWLAKTNEKWISASISSVIIGLVCLGQLVVYVFDEEKRGYLKQCVNKSA